MDFGGISVQDAPGGVSSTGDGSFDTRRLKTPVDLAKLVDTLKRQRTMMEADWRLNLAFYRGRQYSYYNRSTGRLDSLPTEDGDKPRYRVRLVSNQIAPGVRQLAAKFTKTKPVFTATPGGAGPDEAKAAEEAEDLFEYWWKNMRLYDKQIECLVWGFLAGQGFAEVLWDPHCGEQTTYVVDPNGKPIVGNDTLRDMYLRQVAAQGLPAPTKTIFQGDISVRVLSPFDVFLDPTVDRYEDCAYVIIKKNMTPEAIKTLYGVSVTADAAPTSPEYSLPFRNSDNATQSMVKAVWHAYFRPTPSLPKGRYVCWIEGVDNVIADTPYPEALGNDLPVVKIGRGKPIPNTPYDDPLVSDIRPIQKELNRTLSQIVEFKNLTIRPQVWAPANSLVSRLTTEPGAINYYNPVNGLKPELAALGNLPPYVFEHVNLIMTSIQAGFGLNEIDQGSVPPNVEAGIAIDMLQEQATDKFAPDILMMEEQLARMGQLMLRFAQKFYTEPRLMQIAGPNGSTKVKKFSAANLKGNIDVDVETGSSLPRSRAGKQAFIMQLVTNGILDPAKAWKYIDLGDAKAIQAKLQLDEDQALREHDKLVDGVPIDMVGYQQAEQQAVQQVQQAVQQSEAAQFPPYGQDIPMDPGDLPPDPEAAAMDAQEQLKQALVAPKWSDNHQAHIEVHTDFMKTEEYEALPVDVQERFQDHVSAHYQILLSLPQTAPEPAKTTLQVKTAVGPTVLAKLLRTNGVSITPDEAAEPPLDTWVTEDQSKPMDPNAPTAMGEMVQQQQQQALQQQQAQMQMAGQQQQQQIAAQQAESGQAHKAADAIRQDAVTHQQMRHAEEMHQAKLAAVKAQAAASVQAKRQGAKRPKGK